MGAARGGIISPDLDGDAFDGAFPEKDGADVFQQRHRKLIRVAKPAGMGLLLRAGSG